MKNRYESPDFRMIGIAQTDILTLSVQDVDGDGINAVDYSKILW